MSQREYAATSIATLARQLEDANCENRLLSHENIALSEQLAEFLEVFTFTEVADTLIEFGYVSPDGNPVWLDIFNYCADQSEWWVQNVLTAVGGDYLRAIEGGIVLTHLGRAFVFDGLFAD